VLRPIARRRREPSIVVPRWDDLGGIGKMFFPDAAGTLNPRLLAAQHTDSRGVVTLLVQIAIIKAIGWNSNVLHLVSWLALSAILCLCALALRRSVVAWTPAAAWAGALAVASMGAAANWQNLLWSI
jgi:hypothetical protein